MTTTGMTPLMYINLFYFLNKKLKLKTKSYVLQCKKVKKLQHIVQQTSKKCYSNTPYVKHYIQMANSKKSPNCQHFAVTIQALISPQMCDMNSHWTPKQTLPLTHNAQFYSLTFYLLLSLFICFAQFSTLCLWQSSTVPALATQSHPHIVWLHTNLTVFS